MFIEKIKQDISESSSVKELMLNDEKIINLINEIAQASIESISNGGKIIFCGNGGSFSDAQHLSAEFTGKYAFDRDPLASIVLGTNNSSLYQQSEMILVLKMFFQENCKQLGIQWIC